MYLYSIVNQIDHKQYAGITNSIKRRWKEHRTDLNGGRHGNAHLQSAWNKYGANNFKFKKISEFDDSDQLSKAEIGYIQTNNLLDSRYGYNLSPGGAGNFQHTEESKKLISKSQEKSVVAMCLRTGEIKQYDRILNVVEGGFNPKSIANACTDRALTYKKHVWMYLSDYEENPNTLMEKFKNRQNTKARPSRYRKVFGMNIKTQEIIQYGAGYHVINDGFNYNTVRACCVNPMISKTHKGFVWAFVEQELYSKRDIALKNKTHKVII